MENVAVAARGVEERAGAARAVAASEVLEAAPVAEVWVAAARAAAVRVEARVAARAARAAARAAASAERSAR